MLVKVLKVFPYAHDGFTIVVLQVGAVEEIHDALVPGLAEAGYVGEPDEAEKLADADVEIPADWQQLQWFTLRLLAKRISGDMPANKAAAVAVIEAEAARQAAA